MQRPNSSSVPNQHFNPSLIHHFPPPFTGNRVGASPPPPFPPYYQTPATLHSHSVISQPSSFDSFPEERNGTGFSASLPPSPFTMHHSTSRMVAGGGDNLPPRNSHMPPHTLMSPPLVKEEPRQGIRTSEIETIDDILRAYKNLDNVDVLNSLSQTMEVEMESSRGTNGGNSTDSEGDSIDNVKGLKRRAGGDIAHYRSVSMDCCFMPKLNESSPPLPPSSAKVSPGEGNSSVEFGNSKFSAAEMKRIYADQKLAEILTVDPKRVKRILANRMSAARSKERRMQYTAELEHKVKTLQNETTSLSAQLTYLQRDSIGLTNQNNELKFRLRTMEQQAQLRYALSEKLTEEVQRLRLVIGELSWSSEPKTSLNPEMFQQQLRISQLQQQHHSNQNI